MIATCAPQYSPPQVSVDPPNVAATSPRLLSPAESTTGVGSRSMALHRPPNAVTDFTFCESTVGYICSEEIEGNFQGTSEPCQHT